MLLATDLDGTLVGDAESLKRLNVVIAELRKQGKLKLAYVTGRSPELYQKLHSEHNLLIPDALVTAVGTEIYFNAKASAENWPKAINWNREDIVKRLRQFTQLKLQQVSEQRPYKISYILEGDNKTVAAVKSELSNKGVDVLYSHDLYLDVLPQGVNKGSAISYLAMFWQIDTEQVIACGDSGNDIDMLRGNNAVIVNNARSELLEWAKSVLANDKVYIAHHSYAAGILEGLRHYRVTQ